MSLHQGILPSQARMLGAAHLFWLVIVAMICVALAGHALAGEDVGPDWNGQTLTGDWRGIRSDLYKSGVYMDFVYKGDAMADISGGSKRGNGYLGNLDAKFSFDLEKLLNWKGTTAYLHVVNDHGSKVNKHLAGSFMGVDNIETAANMTRIYQAWIQKSFFEDQVSLLAGIYPIDSEFYVTDTSGLFIHPSFGMSAELAQTGRNGPAVFPMAGFGARAKYVTPGRHFFAQLALSDAVPGNPDDAHSSRLHMNFDDGILYVAEFGYTPLEDSPAEKAAQAATVAADSAGAELELGEEYNKTAIGFWRYSMKFDDESEGGARRRPSRGAYILMERTLFHEEKHPVSNLAGFVRFGIASHHIQQSDWSASAGLRYRGLIPHRDDDIAGIAITTSHTSDIYRRINQAESNETIVEATYRVQLRPWMAVQPLIQHIGNPNMDRAVEDAWVLGARLELNL